MCKFCLPDVLKAILSFKHFKMQHLYLNFNLCYKMGIEGNKELLNVRSAYFFDHFSRVFRSNLSLLECVKKKYLTCPEASLFPSRAIKRFFTFSRALVDILRHYGID